MFTIPQRNTETRHTPKNAAIVFQNLIPSDINH